MSKQICKTLINDFNVIYNLSEYNLVEETLEEIVDCFEGTFSYNAGQIRTKLNTVLEKQRQDIIKMIEDEPTEFPVRESDEFDAGGRAFKQALLSKLK